MNSIGGKGSGLPLANLCSEFHLRKRFNQFHRIKDQILNLEFLIAKTAIKFRIDSSSDTPVAQYDVIPNFKSSLGK